MELTRDQMLKSLENKFVPESTKVILLDKLINVEVLEQVGKPGYDTLTRYYGKGEGLDYIKSYVKSLVEKEGFSVGSAIAQFDSNF